MNPSALRVDISWSLERTMSTESSVVTGAIWIIEVSLISWNNEKIKKMYHLMHKIVFNYLRKRPQVVSLNN